MFTRPDVTIDFASPVHPGERVDVTVTLDADSPTEIEHAELTLEGSAWTRWLGTTGDYRQVVSDNKRLADARVLPEGRTTFTATFTVPDAAPPTHSGELFGAQYFIVLHVAIPWWLDVRTASDLVVAPRAGDRPEPRAAVVSSPAGAGPFVELALEDLAFSPGDLVRGAVAVGNVVGRAVEGVDLALVAVELRADSSIEVFRSGVTKMVTARDQGARIDFELAVPKQITPTFESPDGRIAWRFEAKAEFTERAPVAVSTPIVVKRFGRDPRAGRATAGRGDGFAVGTHRWRSTWENAGRRFGLALASRSFELSGELSGRRALVIERDGGLDATLEQRSWDIEVSIEPHRLLRSGITVGHDELDARFDVRGRDEAQVRGVLRPRLVDALLRFDQLHADDRGARVSRAGAAFDERGLQTFLSDLTELAAALADATDTMPAPSAMAEHERAWRAFAAERAARFEPGCMRVSGAIHEGSFFDVATFFSGAMPVRTRVVLHIDPPLRDAVDLGDETTNAQIGIAETVRELRALVHDARVQGSEASFEMEGMLQDPANAVAGVSLLSAIVQRVRGVRHVGPYR